MNVHQRLPTRAVTCLMMFTACWMTYQCRIQMSILVVPMIVNVKQQNNVTGVCVQPSNQGKKTTTNIVDINNSTEHYSRGIDELWSDSPFYWEPWVRGQLLSAYGYGNIAGNFIGGALALKHGPRLTIFWTSLLSALLTLITPLLANVHWLMFLSSRVVIGLTSGVVFPSCHAMLARWSPPDEKGRFLWSLQGGGVGSIVMYPLVALIADNINWEAGWYLPAVGMLVWVVLWYFMAYDSPAEHPRIDPKEKDFILRSQGNTLRTDKPQLSDAPLRSIITSLPFICLVILHFGNLFLVFFYQNSMLLYLSNALGFNLTKGGIIASLPWIGRIVFSYLFGWIGDVVKKRDIITLTNFRKCATVFSHLLPGICLILVGYSGCSFAAANTFLFFALSFNGAAIITNLANNQDLSPNYAGFIYGIMNTIGTTTSIVIPPLVEEIAGKHGNPIDRWQIVFWIVSSVCIASMIVFIMGGSAEIQPWNEPKPGEERKV